jgi:phage shock protein E
VNFDLLLMLVGAFVAAYVLKRLLLGGMKVASNTVKEKIKAGAKVVDVRSPEEFRDGGYPGAVNIPLGDLNRRLGELPKDKPIVVYCASGARSAMAARTMKQAGFVDVVNAGGLGDMPR